MIYVKIEKAPSYKEKALSKKFNYSIPLYSLLCKGGTQWIIFM